jgi:drug/metabolite transporter (DMT)-like permease
MSLSPVTKGLIAALATFSIGVGWHLATRVGATGTLTAIDMALIRFAMPPILLLPLILKRGVAWNGGGLKSGLAMFLGGGLPYGFVVLAGAGLAPVAHMGALLPGTIPLSVSVLAFFLLGERIPRLRLVGLGLSFLGMVLVGTQALTHGAPGSWRGDLLFIIASLCWAFYTIGYRASGLAPLDSTIFIGVTSGIVVVPVWLLMGRGHLLDAPFSEVALQILWQGLGTGIIGNVLYAYAVDKCGPSRTAAFGAMVPVLVAIGGWWLLGEPLDLPTALGCLLASAGVLLSTGLLRRPQPGTA